MATDGATQISLLLVDDHPAVREGLALLLAPGGIAVCAEAADCAQALAALETCNPDVALVDLALDGGESGLDLVPELCARGLKVLVYSMHEDGAVVRQALAAGAHGYVTKREMHRVLMEAVKEVAAGGEYLGQRAAAALAADLARPDNRMPDLALSAQEARVYHLLGDGATAAEIAGEMGVSTRTVESYCARIMEKLEVTGMRNLRRHAIRQVRDRAS